jgi:periplasmic protein TonB
MRRDLIIGIVVSLFLHLSIIGVSEIVNRRPKKVEKKEEAIVVELFKMPELEPEEPETVDADDGPVEEAPMAPPSLVDIPSVVPVDAFVQQVQPPPPPSMGRPTGMTSIPIGRATGSAIGKGLGQIFDLKNLDQQPTPRHQAKPNYPFEMRRAGINGNVLVEFIVDVNGDVRDARVVNSTQREFESAAITAVLKWKFKAGRKGGKAVNTRMQVPIVFSLNDE